MYDNDNYQFAIYNPNCDTIEVSISTNMVLVNATIIFDYDSDIVYLYQLAEESPFTYAKLAMQENGLQDYVDAIASLN